MSLSNEKSIEVNYRRDSFSDRVCDDLCQFILQYLPPKDCIRLECVSKQFQRTVFLSQCSQYFKIPQIRLKSEQMEQLFKKYPKLNKIIFSYNDQEPFEEIIKYCNNLTHIQFALYLMDKEIMEKLFDKFCHKLISIRNWSLNSCPTQLFGIASTDAINIKELTVVSFDSDLSQMKFNRLKKFEVEYLIDEDLDSFELFIENNTKTLKYLDINGIMKNSFNEEEPQISSCLSFQNGN